MFTKPTKENRQYIRLGLVSLLLAQVFVSGCASSAWNTQRLPKSCNLVDRDTIVVPVKGAPLALQSSHFWSGLFFGIPGALIMDGTVDKPKREALLKRMTGSAASLEVVLAEECVANLKRASWASGTNVTLYPGLELMRGTTFEGDMRVFKASYLGDFDESSKAYIHWLTGGPVRTFPGPEGSKLSLVLEVTMVNSYIKGKELLLASSMRLMDPVSGKPIASGFTQDYFKVHPIKNPEDIEAFAADFRTASSKVTAKLLKQLNILR